MENFANTPLQHLFKAISQAQNEAELRGSIMTEVGHYFAASRWGLHFRDQVADVDQDASGIMRLALSLDYNPVLRYVVQRHTAVHDEVILPPGVWQKICPRADHGHVMLGPIVSHNQLMGGIALTRHRDAAAFDANDLADLSALCLHCSARFATLRSQQITFGVDCDRFTHREAQIANLVAQGLTNKEIGEGLWITENSVKKALKRMFRKLQVSSRAEIVAQLSMETAIAATSKKGNASWLIIGRLNPEYQPSTKHQH
ncbi:helix-turn-helix transcriptional regulator [Vacuolonema iberomarrocanum]|uniref:helix-turn-helix transcriptional regulator n=1 Tax=Vacuolonema iberomarrocanum TaxID=3454632 RepID=UPI0019F057BA|nr:LuxR family transcriptional regulator [filamentous cyanobacterium LEGE 07170]